MLTSCPLCRTRFGECQASSAALGCTCTFTIMYVCVLFSKCVSGYWVKISHFCRFRILLVPMFTYRHLLQRAMSCSPTYSVTSHTVQVIGGGGEVVREAVAGPQGAGDLLQAMVGGIPRDAQFTMRVEACNVLLCRTSRAVDLCEWREGGGGGGRRGGRGVEEGGGGKRWGEMSNKGRREEICLSTILENHRVKVTCISPPSLPPSLPPVTTDVQTAAAFFFETFISLSCTFGRGSVARGCVVTLQLGEGEGEVEGGREGEGREVFRLGRQEGSSESSTQCNRTENSRSATDVHVYWSIIVHVYMCMPGTKYICLWCNVCPYCLS